MKSTLSLTTSLLYRQTKARFANRDFEQLVEHFQSVINSVIADRVISPSEGAKRLVPLFAEARRFDPPDLRWPLLRLLDRAMGQIQKKGSGITDRSGIAAGDRLQTAVLSGNFARLQRDLAADARASHALSRTQKSQEQLFKGAAITDSTAKPGDLRDPLTRQLFNGAVKVSFQTSADPKRAAKDQAAIERLTKKLFGRECTPADFAKLSGCPDGGTVQVLLDDDGYIKMWVSHPLLVNDLSGPGIQIWLADTQNGPVLYSHTIFLQEQAPEGLGTRMHATSLNAARELGVSQAVLKAGRNESSDSAENGYYTWPRLGYTRAFTAEERKAFPKNLRSSRDFNDLMSTQAGRDWWRKNGESQKDGLLYLEVQGGKSWDAHQRYLKEKGVRLDAA